MSGHSSGITCPNCGADAYLYTCLLYTSDAADEA